MVDAPRGESVTLFLSVEVAGNLTDLDAPPSAEIFDPASVSAVLGVGTRLGVGRYSYVFPVPGTAVFGPWSIVWTGLLGGAPVSSDEVFEVVPPGPQEATSIATAADVARYVGRPFDDEETVECEAAIARFQADLESWLNRRLGVAARTEIHRLAYDAEYCPVNQGPIVSITSVEIQTIGPLDAAWTQISNRGIEFLVGPLFTVSYPGDTMEVTITYVGGFDAEQWLPARSVIISRTARHMNKRKDDAFGANLVISEGYRVDYDADKFTDEELRTCSRLKRRVLV